MTKHLYFVILLLTLGLLAGSPLAARAEKNETAVWQIGKPDGNYAEMAIAGHFPEFNTAFAQGVHYEVGRSKPETDWPYIQPGPRDVWAGEKEHPFEIAFDLAQTSATLYRLQLDIIDANAFLTPVATVLVNGREADSLTLRPGAGDASLEKPNPQSKQVVSAWIPAGWLKPGKNTITLTTRAGSWILYDCVMLNQVAGLSPVENLTVKSTCLFKGPESALKQIVLAGLNYFGQGEIQATLAGETGWKVEQSFHDARIGEGRRLTLEIPEVKQPEKIHLTLKSDGQTFEADGTVRPEKKWKLYIAPMTHFDNGYTNPQETCLKIHRANTGKALDWCAKDGNFVWDMEAALAEDYLARGSRPEEFIKQMQEGRFGVQGIYANMLTGLCSTEELSRTMDVYDRLRKEHGIESKSATQTDVPSFVGTLPMLLSEHGIKYLSLAGNPYRGMLKVEHPDTPFWWEAPDGSRVLTHITLGYSGLSAVPGAFQGKIDEQGMTWWMDHYLQRQDYPFDAALLHGFFSDNVPADESPMNAMANWNAEYAYPKIIGSRVTEYFEYIEENFAKDLITVKGDQGAFWEDGAGSSAAETAETRQAKNKLVLAERILAMLGALEGGKAKPRLAESWAKGDLAQQMAECWKNILLYDEHTWGAGGSISDPFTSATLTQWDVKHGYAYNVDLHRMDDMQAGELLEASMRLYADKFGLDRNKVVVFNPSTWPRSGFLEFTRGEWHPESSQYFKLDVKDVAPLGGKVMPLENPQTLDWGDPVSPFQSSVIENSFYKVTFDPQTGGICSLKDKQLDRELVDPASPYKLGEYLYVTGAEGSRLLRQVNPADLPVPDKLKMHRCVSPGFWLKRGAGQQTLKMSCRAPMARDYNCDVVLYDDRKQIDFVITLDKEANLGREAGYIAFPFAFKNPAVRIDNPGGVIRPNIDQQPGSCKDWYCAQRFVTVSDAAGAVAWSAPDSPLLTLQDIHRGQYYADLPLKNGWVFAYIFNNYWDTNYKACQGGKLSFRFSLTSAAQITDEAAARFGEEVALPLMVFGGKETAKSEEASTLGNGFAIEGEGIMMESLAPARFVNGVALCLREMAGKSTVAKIPVAALKASKVYRSNLAEDKLEELPAKDGVVEVACRPLGLTTVLVER